MKRPLPEFLNVPWTIGDVLVFVLVWFGAQFAAVIWIGLLSPYVPVFATFLRQAANGDVGATFALDIFNAAAGLAVVWAYLHRYGVGWKSVGWRRVKLTKAVGYILAVMVGFLVVANLALVLVSMLIPGFNANQPQQNDLVGASPSMAVIGLVLLPPILEETIFRGFVFPAMAKKWGVVWGAVASSALFGIAHMQPNIFVYTFPLGLLLCFMYLRLKSIIPGIALHMLNNLLALYALTASK